MTDHVPEQDFAPETAATATPGIGTSLAASPVVRPAGHDLRDLTDQLRRQHRVVLNDRDEHVLLRHADVVAAALDDTTFSNAVSAHLQVPNGLDGEQHTAFREALDPFLSAAALERHLPTFVQIAAALAAELPTDVPVNAVTEVGAVFAVRAQSAWLGWPAELEAPLVAWVADNQAATRAGDRTRTAEVAAAFDAIITQLIESRRGPAGEVLGDDVTADLMRTQVQGRRLTDDEVVSVLRNWTGGDLGSIALCVGVLLHHLASHQSLQDELRASVRGDDSSGGSPLADNQLTDSPLADSQFDAVIDEVLRIDDPFTSNRRVTTCPVSIGGVDLPAGAKVKLHWTSANRDEEVFGDPDAFDPHGHAPHNLVYGLGRHVCPGRLLATAELRILLRALLGSTRSIALAADASHRREVFPVGGWAEVAVVLSR